MECNQLIALLLTTIAGLVTALIWVVKTGRKDVMNTMNSCSKSLDRNTEVMKEVVELLKNWRGH
jgi:hypothetical protein